MSLISVLKKKNKTSLFTTPSHSGKICSFHKFYQWYKCDISETDTHNPIDALKKAQDNAAKIYGVKKTFFLTNGSTSGILAAVLASCEKDDKLLIWDNAHPCHRNAGKLAGATILEYKLPYNQEWDIHEKLTSLGFENIIKKHLPKAVIVTSPTYEGIVSDIKSFSNICKKYNVILIVDEAHGALYPFSNKLPESAIKYADFTVQSLHKTAGGINPTALLHTNNCNLDIEAKLKMITTTSPSYPMLATIEANINFLNSSKGKRKIEELITNIQILREKLKNFSFYGDDITKILIKKDGLSGYELSEILFNKFLIEDERTNEKSTLLLTGIGTTKEKLRRLEKLNKI